MPSTLKLGARHHSFPDLGTLAAKASPKRSGDELLGWPPVIPRSE